MKNKLPLSKIEPIAEKVMALLAPHCERIEIAGSIRRQRPLCGDIEIVCIPKPYEASGLFISGIATVVNTWQIVKGQLGPKCRFVQCILPEGISLDLFFCRADNWGLILAIRTGSADFSHIVLATGWVKKGYHSIGGMLTANGRPVPIKEEIELFQKLGLEYIEPEKREIPY